MLPVSVVIIVKNECANIGECIRTATAISTDIIVVDGGSTDNTVTLAKAAGAKVIQVTWKGYATSRNVGASHAINDWIFALDADERITESIVNSLCTLQADTPVHFIFGFKRENYFLYKKIRFGDWGRDVVYRLYNRQATNWKNVPVHETLQFAGLSRQIRKGKLLHYTVTDMEAYSSKMIQYAFLSAQKKAIASQKHNLLKKAGSPVFNFINCYIIRLGFLDGKAGFIIALHIAFYSWMKYNYDWSKEANIYSLQAAHK
ncbi:MAG: glycosyltransferase family 2 protein [Filimonas sp.]|nr:glycosyltransferase family 2 protein [Filimonas sp.]